MEPLLVGGLIVAGVGSLAVAVWASRDRERTRDQLFRRVAHLRGHLVGRRQVEAVVGHSVVSLSFTAGPDRQAGMRAIARWAVGSGPVFTVVPAHALLRMERALGAEDIALGGDDEFDERFVVRTSTPELTRAVWTVEAKYLLRTHLGARAHLSATRESVEVSLPGVPDEPTFHAMLDLVGALASFGARDLERYEELPDAQLVPPLGPWLDPDPAHVVIQTPRGLVDIEALPNAERPRIRLRIEHQRELPTFSVDLDGTVVSQAPKGLFGERTQALLASVGRATLTGADAHMRLTWSSPPPVEVLEAGVRLLVELSDPRRSTGAFR